MKPLDWVLYLLLGIALVVGVSFSVWSVLDTRKKYPPKPKDKHTQPKH